VAPEAFYGLFRENLPSNLTLLQGTATRIFANIDARAKQILGATLDLGPEIQKQALTAAQNANIIPANLSIDAILGQLSRAHVAFIARQPFVSGKTPITDLLATSSATQDQQRTFVEVFVSNQGTMRQGWQSLEKDHGFSKEVISDLKVTLNLGAFTKNHLPLVQKLKEMRQSGKIDSPRDLAKLDVNQWAAILSSKVNGQVVGYPPNIDGKTDQEKITAYAHELAAAFTKRYPTTALVGRIQADPKSPVNGSDDLLTFFNNHPAFRLENTHVGRFIAKRSQTALAGVKNAESLVVQLKVLQRVYKLSPDYASVKMLLASNIDSSHQIYAMGEDRFIETVTVNNALTKSKAIQIYRRAEQTYATTLALLMDNHAAINKVTPAAVPDQNVASAQPQLLKDVPDLLTLFGSMDFCQCQSCRSVYSPAAYLVDILRFLAARKSNGPTTPGKFVEEVLFARRPDIGQIQLSCENTNTPLPYIDLVNEL